MAENNAAVEALGLNANWRSEIGTDPEPAPASEPEAVQEEPEATLEAETEPEAAVTQDEGEEPPEAPVEAAPVEPEPKPPVEAKPERKEHTVPLSVFKETRDELRELRAEVSRARAEREKPVQEAKPAPDPNEDPEAFERWERDNDRARVSNIEQALAQTAQAQKQAAFEKEVSDRYTADYHTYVAKDPSAADARQYVLHARKEIAENNGVRPDQMERHMFKEDLGFAMMAYRLGMNPAQYMKGIAVSMGYQIPGLETAPAASAPAPEAPDAKAQLEQIAKGKKAAGAAPAGGAKTNNPLTPEDALVRFSKSPEKYRAWFNGWKAENRGTVA
jgi:hypothetical protein